MRPASPCVSSLADATPVIASGTVSFSIEGFMAPYGIAALHLDPDVAFLAAVALGAATVATAPLGGWLADRVGRPRSVVASRLAIARPGFSWAAVAEGGTSLLVVTLVLAAASTVGTPAGRGVSRAD